MNVLKCCRVIPGRLKAIGLALIIIPMGATGAIEQTFDVLQIGTRTYKNVTVTTKAKDYIFILHSRGMNNVKVADLPGDIRDKLGYNKDNETASVGKIGISGWARQTMVKIETPRVKELEKALRGHAVPENLKVSFDTKQLLPLLLFTGVFYLIFCYCAMMICQKTGNQPGLLVFLPILQWFPLLRAAGMPLGWFVALLIPGLNIFALIAWAINIAEARGKSGWVALFLILPGTNVLAFLYLALSNGTTENKEDRRIEVMTL
jgi:hypothetical protein